MTLLACTAMVGCGGGSVAPLARGAPQTTSGDAFKLDDPATQTTFAADATRLPDDVRRAAEALEWGVLGYYVDPKRKRYEPKTWRGVVYMRALLPNGRRAKIIASSADAEGRSSPQHVTLRLRVGSFGISSTEQRYVDSLRKVLAGRAMPVRGIEFDLPPLRTDGQTE